MTVGELKKKLECVRDDMDVEISCDEILQSGEVNYAGVEKQLRGWLLQDGPVEHEVFVIA